MNDKGFNAISEEASRVGWPAAFCEDLTVHDRAELSRPHTTRQFGWVLRECGTEITFPEWYQTHQDWMRAVWHVCGRDNNRWYWFDGTSLQEVGYEGFLATWHEAWKALQAPA